MCLCYLCDKSGLFDGMQTLLWTDFDNDIRDDARMTKQMEKTPCKGAYGLYD